MDLIKPNTNAGVQPNVPGDTEKKGPTVNELKAAQIAENDAELNAPYVDKRSVTISPVQNYSAYRRVNIKSLGVQKQVIGSSFRSCAILSSTGGEVEKYYPELVGLSPNNPDFITRVKAYLSNIQFVVSEQGVELDCSFRYEHKKDYLAIVKKEEEINARKDAVAKNNTAAIKKAVKDWVTEMTELEATKYQFGRPVNIRDYIIYRHCLLYPEVAKDLALINSDPTLRFYIKDEAKEAEKTKKLVEERKTAMANFITLEGNEKRRKAVYIQMIVDNHGNIGEALLKDNYEISNALMRCVQDTPDKFNKLVSDKNVELKAFIETLISRGELIRAEYNQQISTADGTFIGSNMSEAIAYFNNPANKDVLEAYKNKAKLF